jgi:hypothetical protein
MMSAKVSVALYQLGFDPNSRHSMKRAFNILHDIEECKKFLGLAVPNHSFPEKSIQFEVDKLLREHNNMPMLTRSEFSGTSKKKEKKMTAKKTTAKKKTAPKAKAEKGAVKKITLIGLEGSVKKRGFNEGSLRATCFGLVKDGMTVDAYVKAAEKKDIAKARAVGALSKMTVDGIVSVAA